MAFVMDPANLALSIVMLALLSIAVARWFFFMDLRYHSPP